ncbi:MAG: T9SS type A sorting domain-containing protein, partial [candidate division WOR-3 bacterium]|nr:T9SS type A sorting domain-containing protein [candidate division WOR-3 bacterium]
YATTASLCQNNHNYYFSAWCKTTSWLAGSFIITWFKITQQPAGNPIIIPIIRSTSYYHYTQMLQSPDSAILVNINIVTLPFTTINVDDVTLSDTVLSGIEDGSNNSKELSRLKFYPNPCRTNIEINYDEEIEHLALYDISGQLILKISHPSPPRLKLDVSKYPNGIYFIQQQANKKVAILKFIKQN